MSPEDIENMIQTAVTKALASLAPVNPSNEILTQDDLVKRLGVSKETLITWGKRGLPCLRAGGLVRYKWDDVLKYMENKRKK